MTTATQHIDEGTPIIGATKSMRSMIGRAATLEDDHPVLYRGYCPKCSAVAPFHTEACPRNEAIYGAAN